MISMHTKPGLLAVIALAGLTLLTLAGCGKKETPPVKVGEMTEYRDPGYGFRIQYPKDWVSNSEVGRALFFSEQDVDKKFLDPDGPYPNGALISVTVSKTPNPSAQIDSAINGMKSIGIQVAGPQQLTVADKPATRYTYTARYTGGTANGEHVYIPVDTTLYDVWFAGFGDMYQAHKDVFAASLNSLRLPRPAAPGADETLPSQDFVEAGTRFFTMSLPENFVEGSPSKGSFEYSAEWHNSKRLDCAIRFDIFDAKGQNAEKVFDQNKGKYRSTGTGKATIGGEPAFFVSYSATKDVNARAYFLVHSAKALRVTTTWYKPQEKEYLAAFEKVISSIRFK